MCATKRKIGKVNLVVVDEQRIDKVIDLYFQWKDLDQGVRSLGTRGINFPSTISEHMVGYTLSYHVNVGSGGDLMDCTVEPHRKIEVKAQSSENPSPSSFSPSEQYDELIFAKLDKKTDKLHIFKTNLSSEDVGNLRVNQNQILKDQQGQGRRPRLLFENTINALGITVTKILDIRRRKIITP